jgi:hypothetical protein
MTDSRAHVIRKQAFDAGLPSNTHLFVLPKNHSARNMDSVETPIGVPETEMDYQRSVCYAMGVPCNLVLQFMQTGRSSTSTGTTNDTTSHSTQMLRSTCTRVASSLCDLLKEVYTTSYPMSDDDNDNDNGDSDDENENRGGRKSAAKPDQRKELTFHINCTATMELGDIVELHFRKLVKDEAINEMLLASIGFPLDKTASRLPWNKTVQEPTPPGALGSSKK